LENRAHALAAGLFTLLLSAGVVYAAMWLTRDTTGRESFILESAYPVTGLGVQASVRLRGVEVGKVQSIDFDPENRRLILIGITVKAGTPITQGTTARLESQGLTGLAYVMLDDDGKRPQRLAAEGDVMPRIPVRQTFLDEISGTGRDLLSQLTQVAVRVDRLLSERNQEQLVRTLASLEAASADIGALARTIDAGARNLSTISGDARKVLKGAEVTLDSIDTLARQLGQHVDTLERFARSTEQMATSAGQVGGATQSFSTAVVGDTLPRLNVLIEDLGLASRKLDRLLDELNERPHGLVFGKPPGVPGPGEPGFSQPRRATQK
jgi:phospholipid/cholesterol/gamma-HCH transport system substrate-binding protein